MTAIDVLTSNIKGTALIDSPAKYNNFQNLKSLAYIHEERWEPVLWFQLYPKKDFSNPDLISPLTSQLHLA